MEYNWKEIQEHYNNNGTYKTIIEKFEISNYMIRKAIKRGDLIIRSRSEAAKLSRKKFPNSFKISEETKKKISISRIKYLKENPDQVPYLLNHSSKESYPEKYFNIVFKNEKIDVDRYYRVGLYELDFAILNKKIDIEIDGSQHWLDEKIIESDERRTEILESEGWDIIRINWSEYQKQNKDEKEEYIKDLVSYINELVEDKPTFNISRLPKGKDICKCGEEKWRTSKHCMKCDSIKQRKVERPPLDQLLKEIEELGYKGTGKKYGVSDNSIRKWVKNN